MTNPKPEFPRHLSFDDSAVLNYLTTLQGIITRLAANSGSCKTLCVTLVSAIIVVITNKSKPEFAWITFIPIISLGFLDSYYLGLERGFRNTYNNFTEKLINSQAFPKDLFKLIPVKQVPKWVDQIPCSYLRKMTAQVPNTILTLFSPAIWLFYCPLGIIVFLGKHLIFT
jgi:hypothetical protein